MTNSEKYWERMAMKIKNKTQTYNNKPDVSPKDANFIKQYLTSKDEILDIGSGSGLVINKLASFVKGITAVETFKGLSEFIHSVPNMEIINAKLETFYVQREFDIALCTGVMQFFEKKSASQIYTNIYKMLKNNGIFIMRMHCGLKETVVINHSKELEQEYFAEYRQVDEEKKLLENIGFSDVQVLDQAPEELNIYDNTRHFMFVCKK